jgi:serine/threonine-protein kinase HipA
MNILRQGKFRPVTLLHVEINLGGKTQKVGRLALRDRIIYFEYDRIFLKDGFELSPFRLKRTPDLIKGPPQVFEGLHGLFNDSLPDGWGHLLMDRQLVRNGLHPSMMSPLDRLAWVGSAGMGALTYRPEHPALSDADDSDIDLDMLAGQSRDVLEDNPQAVLDALIRTGGSPQGARPKVLVGLSQDHTRLIHGVSDLPPGYEHWMVKFRSMNDSADSGAIEFAYGEMARAAGVEMPPTRLFAAAQGPGYFGIKRFDRIRNQRLHMHTISGLLNATHLHASISYSTLLKATRSLVRHQAAVEQMFTRMVFNVFACNRDDHTKNHSFLLAEDGIWKPSPAYDVTFTFAGGEHALDIAGEGRRPGITHILAVADDAGVGRAEANAIISRVRHAVSRWPEFAGASGVSDDMISVVGKILNGIR